MVESRLPRLLVAGLSWPLETFLQRLIVGLSESGVEVTVSSSSRPDGLPVRWIRVPSWTGPPGVRESLSMLQAGAAWCRSPRETRLLMECAREEPARKSASLARRRLPLVGHAWEVVYFPWNSAAAAHLPVFGLGKKVIVSCRGSQMNIAPHNPKRREEVGRYVRALELASCVHCVSDALRRSVEGHGISAKKIRVIRPAVDPEFFKPMSTANGANGVLRLGHCRFADLEEGV